MPLRWVLRLKDFNNKISRIIPCVPLGVVVKLRPDAPKVRSSIPNTTFISWLLFFSSFFSFSFRLVFILRITVLLCFYIELTIFSSRLYLPFPRSPSRGPAIYIFLVNI